MTDEIVIIEARLDGRKAKAELDALTRGDRQVQIEPEIDRSAKRKAETALDTTARDRKSEIKADVDGAKKAERTLDVVARDRKSEIKADVDGAGGGFLQRLFSKSGGLGDKLKDIPGLGGLASGLSSVGESGLAAEAGAAGAAEGLAGLGAAAIPAAAVILPVAAALATLAVSYAAADVSLDAFVEQAGKVRGVVATSGLAAEDASKVVEAFDDLGVNAETVAKIFGKLQLNRAKGKLVDFGIDNGADAAEALGNIADKIAATPDPAERTRIAVALLGRDAARLVPLLARGSESLQEMYDSTDSGLILSADDLANAKKLGLAFDGIKDTFAGILTGVGADIAPTFIEFAGAVDDLAPVLRVVGTTILQKVVSPIVELADKGAILVRLFENAGDAAEALGGTIRNSVVGAIRDILDAIPGGSFLETVFGDQLGLVDVDTSVFDRIVNGTADAADEATRLEDEFAAAEAQAAAVAERTKEITDNIQAALDSVRAATDAQFGLQNAQVDLSNLAGGIKGENEAAAPKGLEETLAQTQAAVAAVDAAVTAIDSSVQQQVDSGALNIEQKAGAVLLFVQQLRDQQIELGTNPAAIAQLDAYIAKLNEVRTQTATPVPAPTFISNLLSPFEKFATPAVVPVTADTTAAEAGIGSLPAKAAATSAVVPVNADTTAAQQKLSAVTQPKTVKIKYEAPGLNGILDRLTNVRDKTIKIRVNYEASGAIPRFAGGPTSAGALYEIAERGPELWRGVNGATMLFNERQFFVPPSAGTVLTAAQTRRTINNVSSAVSTVSHGSPQITVVSPHPLLAGKDVHRAMVKLAKSPKAGRR